MDPIMKRLFREAFAVEGAARFGARQGALTFAGGFQNFIYIDVREGKNILRFTPGALRPAPAGQPLTG